MDFGPKILFYSDSNILVKAYVHIYCNSERADTDMYRLSAPIWAICRYIGFADKHNTYRYR